MRLGLFVLPLIIVMAAGAASATDDAAPDCDNLTTQADMNLCAADSADRADAALNAQYKLTRKAAMSWDKGLDEADRGAEKALLGAQRAWIAYRDAECSLEGFSTGGGSMQPLIISGCLERLTKARTQELKQISEDFGN